MPGYGARYWAERTPLWKRAKYPVCRGELSADVVVVGGGLTGTIAACVLSRGGLDVVMVEADRIASGATAAGAGCVVPQPAAAFLPVIAAQGRREARLAWKETRSAALELAAAIRRLRIRCDLQATPLIVNAIDDAAARVLRREQAARRAAGLAAPWQTSAALEPAIGTATAGGFRLDEPFTIDPVRAALGFAHAADDAGARLFERSRVKRTRFTRDSAEVVLTDAVIHTAGIYVATSTPSTLFPQLRRHVREYDAFTVVTEPLTSAMKRQVGRRAGLVTGSGDNPHWLRWLKDDRAMFSGAAGPVVPPARMDKVLVQRTGQLMYELSLRHPVISGLPAKWSWPQRITSTADDLPWVGPHRNHPFHFFALATGWHGEALAWFAAKAALRHFKGEPRPGDDVFAFTR